MGAIPTSKTRILHAASPDGPRHQVQFRERHLHEAAHGEAVAVFLGDLVLVKAMRPQGEDRAVPRDAFEVFPRGLPAVEIVGVVSREVNHEPRQVVSAFHGTVSRPCHRSSVVVNPPFRCLPHIAGNAAFAPISGAATIPGPTGQLSAADRHGAFRHAFQSV